MKFPGTPTKTAIAENLVAQTGGHFVTIVRPGVGELLGVHISALERILAGKP